MDSCLRRNDKQTRKKVIIMPQFNGTGPAGGGPRTGRGLGPCGAGLSWQRGYSFGRFKRWCPYQSRITKKEEAEILNEEVEMLQEELKAAQERLSELKKQK